MQSTCPKTRIDSVNAVHSCATLIRGLCACVTGGWVEGDTLSLFRRPVTSRVEKGTTSSPFFTLRYEQPKKGVVALVAIYV
jgi:hypothetical protein